MNRGVRGFLAPLKFKVDLSICPLKTSQSGKTKPTQPNKNNSFRSMSRWQIAPRHEVTTVNPHVPVPVRYHKDDMKIAGRLGRFVPQKTFTTHTACTGVLHTTFNTYN